MSPSIFLVVSHFSVSMEEDLDDDVLPLNCKQFAVRKGPDGTKFLRNFLPICSYFLGFHLLGCSLYVCFLRMWCTVC